MPITLDSEQLRCPMTLEIMDDPVVAEDGHTYERSAITRWINEHGTSPMTRMRMHASELRPNLTIRALIDTYRTQSQRTAAQEPQNIAGTIPIEQENLAVIQDILQEDQLQVNLSNENRPTSSPRYDQRYYTGNPYNSSNFRRNECDYTGTVEYEMNYRRDPARTRSSHNRSNNRRQRHESDSSIYESRSSRHHRNRHEYNSSTETDEYEMNYQRDPARTRSSHNRSDNRRQRYGSDSSLYQPHSSRYHRNPHEHTSSTETVEYERDYPHTRFTTDRNRFNSSQVNYNESVGDRFSGNRLNYQNPPTNNIRPIVTSNNISTNYPAPAANSNTHSANSNYNNQSSKNERTTCCNCSKNYKAGCCVFICFLIIAIAIAVPIILTLSSKPGDTSTIMTTKPTATTTKATTTTQQKSFAFRCNYDLQIILLTLLGFYISIIK